MKKFTGILLALLLIFTAVSCSFFMEEKDNNSESLVSFSLSGKSSKEEGSYFISEYITYGESTVQYGTWTDMAWDIWYYTTDTEAVLFTTPSEIAPQVKASNSDWKEYKGPFRVTKGVTVWAYCENTLTSATNKNVTDEMFKGIAHEKISKTKTYITVVPQLDEKVAFEPTTTGTVLIDTLTYIMSEDQATVTSGSDISKLKVVVSMGNTSCTDTKALVTDTNHPYGYTTFSNIKLEGVKASEGPTTPSSIKVEFYGYKEDGETKVLLDSYNVYELSDANTNKVVELYVLNGLTTELKGITVENKTIKLGIVYINTTETDMFPEKYNTNPSNAFNIKAEAPGATVALVKVGTPSDISLVYAINNAEYKDYTIGQEITLPNEGDKVYFKAKTSNTEFSTASDAEYGNYYHFVFTGEVSCSGNINYLLDANGIVDEIPEEAIDYTVTKEEFDKALGLEGVTYLQMGSNGGLPGVFTSDVINKYSPTVYYSKSVVSSPNGENYTEMYVYKINDSVYKAANRGSSTDPWDDWVDVAADLWQTPANIGQNLLDMLDSLGFEFDPDKFNVETKSYVIPYDDGAVGMVDLIFRFENKKLLSFDLGAQGEYTYSYDEVTPELPIPAPTL